MSDRDISAISTWDRREEPEDRYPEPPQPYVCDVCDWHGRGGVKAFAHHRVTGHAVRGKHWPPEWGPALFPKATR